MPSSLLYCVVATHGNQPHIERCLNALAANTAHRTRTIVVDNASDDATRAWLRQRASDGLVLIQNEGNVGAASAWNIGLRVAMANGAQAVLVCGSDTVVNPGCIERLVKLIQQGCAFVTGTQVAYDSTEQVCPPLQPGDQLALSPDFSCFLLPMPTVEALARHEAQHGASISPWELGLFDARFAPAYFEDNDYHTRLDQAGLVAVRDPQATFRHDCSLTIRTHPDLAKINQESFIRNRDLFVGKHGALPHELPTPPGARPLNVTDEQWQRMTGGRPVQMVDQAQAAEAARQVYGRYIGGDAR